MNTNTFLGRKPLLWLGFMLAAITLFTACEKVIDVDLEAANRRYVVEAVVTNDSAQPVQLLLSQTMAFAERTEFNGVGGAVASIRVDGGAEFPLTQARAGVYETRAFVGQPGHRYDLRVQVNGQTFTATSTMPRQLVSLDSLWVEDLAAGGDPIKTIYPSYQDPPGTGNAFRFVQYANGVQVRAIFVQNDARSEGLRITRPLVNPDGVLKRGDLVRVDLLHISAPVYLYWFSLDQAATGSSQATPANPVSNVEGGALGYFSAHSVDTRSLVLP